MCIATVAKDTKLPLDFNSALGFNVSLKRYLYWQEEL